MIETRSPNAQEEKLKLKAAEQLEADRVKLLIEQPFVGAILIRQNLIPVVDSRCDTASTDGQNIFVSPEFYLSLSPGERRFLLAHEVWHTVFLHFLRHGKRDVNLFNIACDMEINAMLRNEKFKLPDGALLPEMDWIGLNAEEIYERMLQSAGTWSKPLDIHLEPENDNNAVTVSGRGGEVDESGKARGNTGEDNKIERIIDPDYNVDFGNHPEDLAKEKVIEAVTQVERKRGKLPENIAAIVENFRAGKLHWKELLAQFVTSSFGASRRWLPPNRRYISSGLYLQSRRDSKLKAVLAIDTSGSTKEDMLIFADELVSLLGTFGSYELKVICCDSKIQSVETYSDVAPFDGKKCVFSGGGGTSFKPVFEYLQKEHEPPELLIYFTDGYGDFPEKPSYPVMWGISPKGINRIPWGIETKMN